MIFERIRHPFSPSGQFGDGPDVELPDRIVFEGARKQALETGRNRLVVTGVLFALAFVMIGGRVIELTLISSDVSELPPRLANTDPALNVRADITDRNGILLATSLPTAALYANPRHVLDADEAAGKLSQVLPDMAVEKARALLSSDKTFVWLHRNLTPKLQFAVNALGIPGLYFQQTERRVYPHGPLVSHVIGMTNIDGEGLSGVEGYFNGQLRGQQQALQLSLDIRMQAVVRTELIKAMDKFSAIGAAGIVLDVETGEVIAMVSLPDFNPNNPVSAAGIAGFNRATKGVYEMGSTFKLFTAAIALDSGRVGLKDRYDATKPIRVSRFKISDYHAKNKWMTVPEIIVHSSNIGSARMALDVGTRAQKKYLKDMGMLSPAGIELPEVGSPLTPDRWRDINTMTISYGHGIAVSPIQLTTGVAALVNDGYLRNATVVKWVDDEPPVGMRVISAKTSKIMRRLMRLVVRKGTGKNADVEGYVIGGKTGTADKPEVSKRGYGGRRRISSFVSAFPMTGPRFVVLALLDEPKGIPESQGYATGGWVAAPVVKNIVRQIAPMAGIEPSSAVEPDPKPGDVFFIAADRKRVSKQHSMTHKKQPAAAKLYGLETDFNRRLSDILSPTNGQRGPAVAVN